MCAFRNPIVEGEQLIISGIHSEGYVPGVSGWRIAKDGAAEFQNAVIDGDITAKNANFDTLTVGGLTIPQIVANDTRGIVAFANGTNFAYLKSVSTATPIGLFEMQTLPLIAGRLYMLHTNGIRITSNTVAQDTVGELQLRSTSDPIAPATPTNAMGVLYRVGAEVGNGETTITMHFPFIATGALRYRFLLSLARAAGTATLQAVETTYDTAYMWLEDLGPMVLDSGATNDGGGTVVPPAKTRYQTFYSQTVVQSYDVNNNKRTDSNGSLYAYQGWVSGVWGNELGAFFFDSAKIRADLAGATPVDAKVWLQNTRFYNFGGGTAWIGTHNHDPSPATIAALSERRWQQPMANGGNAWTPSLGPGLCDELKQGVARGIVVGHAPDTNTDWYSYFPYATLALTFDK